jgi:peroxiredoxin
LSVVDGLSLGETMMSRALGASLMLLAVRAAVAGEFNPVLNVGDAAPAWADLPGTDGKNHSLIEHDAKSFVLVVFTCNSCPVARDYEERIAAFTKAHADVAVVAVNVNRVPEDSLDKMKERATAFKFPYQYLFDESQQIAKDYGAQGTPEFFLLSPAADGARKVVYMGAMDDNSDRSKVTKQYLADALAAVRQGKPAPVGETYAPGCRIRFARERR